MYINTENIAIINAVKYCDQWAGVKSRSDFLRNAKCFEVNNRPEDGGGLDIPDNDGRNLRICCGKPEGCCIIFL
ncbi:hypothetical protein DERF_002291 [Dermatophagoides farinae]|uniref:Uncharacterized protein n=1 Tax=Dermatophagoides farinae TaxID=6954 RepID=A0A922LAG9_DERFA|nr:hypothetical protein DERF_002291 [Dermatophagoides farinae]